MRLGIMRRHAYDLWKTYKQMAKDKHYNRIMLGRKSCFAEECISQGYIGADFDINEDLTGHLDDNWRRFNERYIPIWMANVPGKSRTSAGISCGFLWTVCKGLQIGDIVLSPNGSGYYYVGTITSDYYYVPDSHLPHRRKVKWTDRLIAREDMTERLRNSTGSIGTCCDVTKYGAEIEELIRGAKATGLTPSEDDGIADIEQDLDPEEMMHETHIQLRNKLADELLDYIITLSPEQFEKLVLQLLVKMGYGAAIHTGKSNDEGIDGIIEEDKLGLDEIHIQAKRYQIGNNIGRETLQAFVGALAGQNARKGLFITTSDFTKQAKEYQPSGVKIVKINGVRLAELMIEYNLGVRVKHTYEVKGIDKSFFEE